MPLARTALTLAVAWCVVLAAFALSSNRPLALALLFVAGFLELAFSSMAQTLVQMNAPAAARGRVIGLFNMSALGMRTFSGLTVGVAGALVGLHVSLAAAAAAAAAVFVIAVALLVRDRRGGVPAAL